MTAVGSFRSVDEADVYKGDRLAGTLVRDGDHVMFSYNADYLSDERAPAIAHTLPRTSEKTVSTGGSVPPFFAGLLPEGVRLRAVALGTRTSEDDHFTLLLAVGQDAIGDVRVVPAGEPPEPPAPLFDDEHTDDTDLAALFTQATDADPATLDRVALPGVQVKVSAQLISTPVVAARGPAILKLNPAQGYPRLVHNEHFFLTMAADCGLPTPQHRLIHDRHGQTGLLVTRFDRVHAPSGHVRMLAQEDACQILGVYPASKYRLKTEQIAYALADVVSDGDGSRQLTLRRVLELTAFSYLIGNGDLHGKNFSARQSPAGFWDLTPAYDLLTTQPYLSWQDPMALNLYGRANRLNREHVRQSGTRLGLPRAAVTSALDRICDAAPAHIDRLNEIGFDTPTTERLANLLRQRLTELRGDVLPGR